MLGRPVHEHAFGGSAILRCEPSDVSRVAERICPVAHTSRSASKTRIARYRMVQINRSAAGNVVMA